MSFQIKKNRAYGTFEFAILFTIASSLLFGVWGVSSMFQAKSKLETKVKSALLKNSSGIYSLTSNGNLQINNEQLKSFLAKNVAELKKEILQLHKLTPGEEMFIEGAIGELDIDENEGSPIGSVRIINTSSSGNKNLGKEFNFSEFKEIFKVLNKQDNNGMSIWAMPLSSNQQGNTKFLSKVFFIGIRAFVKAKGFANFFKSALGKKPIYYTADVSPLRGEINL